MQVRLLCLFDLQIVIPCHVAQGEIHEKLRHLFDNLIANRVVDRVMIAPSGEGDADEKERDVEPRQRNVPEDALSRYVSCEKVQTEKSENTHCGMDCRAVWHGGRSDEDRFADVSVPFDHENASP